MFEEMERDPAVVVIGETWESTAAPSRPARASRALRLGARDRHAISESAIIGAACGMSYLGLRPICEMQFIDSLPAASTSSPISLPKATICGMHRPP